jgi:hypothetical protein
VVKTPVPGASAEAVGVDNETGVENQLGESERAEEGGLAALVCSGQDDQALAVGVDVVAGEHAPSAR